MARRVMIVDDAIFMRKVLREILSDNGYEIAGEVSRGNEVVPQYEALKPDLVTLDIMLPGTDGIEALKALMAKAPKARVVMISSLGQDELVNEALQAGAKGFIIKPFIPKAVVSVLEKAFH